MSNIWRDFEKIIETKLKEKYEDILESEEDVYYFVTYMKKKLRPAIRINTLKISLKEGIERLKNYGLKLEQIPWFKEAFWIVEEEEVYGIGNLKEHLLGYFYLQEAASLIPPIAMDLKEDLSILDLAAAPGSKTTQIAQMVRNTGIIVANDVSKGRLMILVSNLQRMGVLNAIVTNFDGTRIHERVKAKFERVLLDAPCSSEGAIRRSYSVLNTWSERNIINLARLQKRLIEAAFKVLEVNGILVYSTCTLDPRENEGVVSYLLDKYDNAKLLPIKIEGLKYRKAILEWRNYTFNPEVEKAIRIWPQDNDTEGFFVAKITKEYE